MSVATAVRRHGVVGDRRAPAVRRQRALLTLGPRRNAPPHGAILVGVVALLVCMLMLQQQRGIFARPAALRSRPRFSWESHAGRHHTLKGGAGPEGGRASAPTAPAPSTPSPPPSTTAPAAAPPTAFAGAGREATGADAAAAPPGGSEFAGGGTAQRRPVLARAVAVAAVGADRDGCKLFTERGLRSPCRANACQSVAFGAKNKKMTGACLKYLRSFCAAHPADSGCTHLKIGSPSSSDGEGGGREAPAQGAGGGDWEVALPSPNPACQAWMQQNKPSSPGGRKVFTAYSLVAPVRLAAPAARAPSRVALDAP